MSEREYYELLEEMTNGGNCEKCSYGIDGNCHLDLHIKQGEYLAFENKILGQYDSTLRNRSTKGSFQSCMAAYRRYSGITDDLPPTVTKKQSNSNIRENEVAKAMFFYEIIDRILLDTVSSEYFTEAEARKSVIEIMEEFTTYMNIYFSDFEREVYNNEN